MEGRSGEGYEEEGPPCGERKKSSILETCKSGRPLSWEMAKKKKKRKFGANVF